MPTDEFMKLAERVGVPVAILFLLACGIAWVIHRLLNKKDGIITVAGQRHVSFVDHVQGQADTMLALTRDTVSHHAEQRQATVNVQKAFVAHAEALQHIANSVGSDTGKLVAIRVNEIKRLLGAS